MCGFGTYIFCCCFGAVLLASVSSARTRSVSLGQSVTLLCEGAANGPIEWRFKQQQQDQWQSVVELHDGGISPGPGFKERVKFVRTENPRNCSITLGPVEFNDGGVYECKALHPDRIFSDVRLEVLDPSQVFVEFGQSVSLPCHGNINKQIRSDELHLRWQKDGQDVYKHQNSKTTYGPGFENRVSVSLDRAPHGDLSLTIKEARLSDQGEYRCVYNIQKENGQPPLVRLNVTASSSSARTRSVSLGQSVTLLCEGAANGPIEWRFKQQQHDQWQSVVELHDGGVSPGPGFKERVKFVRTENPRNCSITLGPVEFTDGGVYECKALHPDRIFSDVRLEVLGPGFKERVKFVCTENLRNCSITLGPVVFNDGGVYECKALHPDHIFSDVRLEVLVPSQVFVELGQSIKATPVVYNIEKENGQPPLVHLNVTGLGVLVLNGVVGQSVAFPAAVKKSGTLRHKGDEQQTIGDVTGSRFRDFREGRVQWNSATGLFSISGLKVDDSGMYTLLNNDERSKEYQYQLNVDDSPLSGGAVAGIVVGLLAFVAAIIAMIIAMRKRRDAKANEEKDANSPSQNMMFPNDPSVPEPRPVPETKPFVPDARTSVRSW
ncbi:hypothetical protein AAFF_G00367890 [Aldrovandia affinis]|uniref:Ig-like domain-containing protein n=1 Tax=Aldrovandia affinis TaxID=143900 RepID=A0AAD7R583_9TELE|nr:hypothetical protein AAFF_G00367890 [Aldrovandia affinis]